MTVLWLKPLVTRSIEFVKWQLKELSTYCKPQRNLFEWTQYYISHPGIPLDICSDVIYRPSYLPRHALRRFRVQRRVFNTRECDLLKNWDGLKSWFMFKRVIASILRIWMYMQLGILKCFSKMIYPLLGNVVCIYREKSDDSAVRNTTNANSLRNNF